MITEIYDHNRDRQAQDLILKLIEDGMSEAEALKTLEEERRYQEVKLFEPSYWHARNLPGFKEDK